MKKKSLLTDEEMQDKLFIGKDTINKELERYENNHFDETYNPTNPIYIFKETI
jgi:hypothetical protein